MAKNKTADDLARFAENGELSRRSLLIGAAMLAGSGLLPEIARAQGAAEMLVAWWGSDDRHQKTLKLLKLFESKHPGLKMDAQYGGLIGYQDKISTQFAGGNAPDIMQISDNREALIASGRLLQLDDAIASGKINLADANKSVVETIKVGGKLYSIPWGLACGCFFLDTKAFQDANVALPGPDWTWDQYAEKAKAINKASGGKVYGSADIWAPAGTRSLYPFEFFLRQRGKSTFTTDGQLGFEQAELTEWFTFWDDLRKAGGVPPAEITAAEGGYETSPIITGKAAMYPVNSSIASSLQALTKNKLVCAVVPNGINSKALSGPTFGAFINASLQVFVNAATKQKDLAVDFLNFVTNDPDAAKVHLMARGVPLSAKIAESILPAVSPIEQSMADVIKYTQNHSAAPGVTWPTTGGQVQDLMQRSHQAIAFGQSSVADAATKFFGEAGIILN
ncbi:ABC transporter substrate-binding protein [Rhizobium jaguaris]|nr:ABC transporter substrate-binding protein [Rhizobium jaguaris]